MTNITVPLSVFLNPHCVVAALKELVLVHDLGHSVCHHAVRRDESKSDRLRQVEVAREHSDLQERYGGTSCQY